MSKITRIMWSGTQLLQSSEIPEIRLKKVYYSIYYVMIPQITSNPSLKRDTYPEPVHFRRQNYYKRRKRSETLVCVSILNGISEKVIS